MNCHECCRKSRFSRSTSDDGGGDDGNDRTTISVVVDAVCEVPFGGQGKSALLNVAQTRQHRHGHAADINFPFWTCEVATHGAIVSAVNVQVANHTIVMTSVQRRRMLLRAAARSTDNECVY